MRLSRLICFPMPPRPELCRSHSQGHRPPIEGRTRPENPHSCRGGGRLSHDQRGAPMAAQRARAAPKHVARRVGTPTDDVRRESDGRRSGDALTKGAAAANPAPVPS